MASRAIIGRQQELGILRELCESGSPQLLAVYGRRRIGKTFLISEFFRDKGIYFELTGIKDADLKTQLKNFAREYADVFQAGRPVPVPTDWFSAFDLLRKQAQEKDRERMIIFLDELPWLASRRSQFLAALDHSWNRYFSRESNLIVIICGSAASWMIKKVLYDKGGLYGRLTRQIRLLPFTLAEARLFLKHQRVVLAPHQLMELYMSVGGVAQYLTQMQPGRSADQLIQGRYFDRNAPLRGEFHKLFSSLFGDYARHLSVIEALASSHYGLSTDQLLKRTHLRSGGGFSDVLSELLESGFITFLPQFGNKRKEGVYLLADEFTLFYLKWVRKWENEIDDLQGYWQRQSNTQSYRTWAGYAFETLCIKNIHHIKEQLGIAAVTTQVSQWHGDGTQIDLVIDRADNCINLCEIKFYNAPYTLTAADAAQLQRKKAAFLSGTLTRKALFLTLITVSGATRNQHYVNTIDCHVQAQAFVGRSE